MVYHVLFNPHAGNGRGEAEARKLNELMPDVTLRYYDMTSFTRGYGDFFAAIDPADVVIVAGGDGTLNRFINDTQALHLENDIQ